MLFDIRSGYVKDGCVGAIEPAYEAFKAHPAALARLCRLPLILEGAFHPLQPRGIADCLHTAKDAFNGYA